jgi:hypothetical protein
MTRSAQVTFAAFLILAVSLTSCRENGDAEVFRLRSDCATLAMTVYEREQRDRAAVQKKVWDMRSRYDVRRNRCYVAYRVADDVYGELVVYDAQSNALVAAGKIPSAPNSDAGDGIVVLEGDRRLPTFVEFQNWVDRFMRDE